MLLKLYKALNILLTPIIGLLLIYRVWKKKEDKTRIKERLGIAKKARPNKKLIWIHAASVGETISTIPLIQILSADSKITILLTSGTVTSGKLVKSILPKNVIHQYVPIENYFAIKNFLKHWKPNLTIFVESEFWPCILSETSKVSKIISLNTRLSDSSFKIWKTQKQAFSDISKLFSLFLPQSINDFEKLKSLGVKKLKYIGNIKYTVPPLIADERKLAILADELRSKKVVLFISSHPGEEEIIHQIYKEAKKIIPSLIFIIAPRHPNRSNHIHSMLSSNNYKLAVRSKHQHISPDTDFYIADTIGELGTLIRVSTISVICGTFVKTGGHNPIEAAKLKSAVIIGPYFSKQAEICSEFKKHKAAIMVKNHRECVKAICLLFSSQPTIKTYLANASKLINSKNNILRDTVLAIRHYIK